MTGQGNLGSLFGRRELSLGEFVLRQVMTHSGKNLLKKMQLDLQLIKKTGNQLEIKVSFLKNIKLKKKTTSNLWL